MKLLFVHDHEFFRSAKNIVYSTGGLPSVIWNRYLNSFSSVEVLARYGGEKDNASNLIKSSLKGVTFNLIPDMSGIVSRVINSYSIGKDVEESILSNDYIIVRLPSALGLKAISAAKRLNKPYLIELVDCPWDGYWNYGGLLPKLFAPLSYSKTKNAVKNAKYVIYVTEYFLQKRYPSPLANSVNCSNVLLDNLTEKTINERYEKIKSPKNKIIFGLIGTLTGKLKGIDTVLESLSKIKNELGDFELRVLGHGDPSRYYAIAKKLGIRNNVFFDGVLSAGDEVFSWLNEIDIYLHPSYKEGLPRALIEAMSRGCPAITSDVAGIPELISEEFMIKPGDICKLTNLIQTLIKNPELQSKLAYENFIKAKNYEATKIEKVRQAYFKKFINGEL
jgi:glycosyltransferase involved in cell wall biosynthesis